MLYKNICGINLNLIKAALFIGTYDIFGTITLIVLEIEFFSQSTYFAEVGENNASRVVNFIWGKKMHVKSLKLNDNLLKNLNQASALSGDWFGEKLPPSTENLLGIFFEDKIPNHSLKFFILTKLFEIIPLEKISCYAAGNKCWKKF